jgi:hypothetical protein
VILSAFYPKALCMPFYPLLLLIEIVHYLGILHLSIIQAIQAAIYPFAHALYVLSIR